MPLAPEGGPRLPEEDVGKGALTICGCNEVGGPPIGMEGIDRDVFGFLRADTGLRAES